MKKLLCLVMVMLLMCPMTCKASGSERIYGESEYVSHDLQDVIFDVLEEDKYEDMDEDLAYLIVAIIERESKGQQYVVSNTGDYGYCQIHISVHKGRMNDLGVTDIYDAKQNIRVCVDILYDLFNMYDGWTNVLMHYNGTANASELYRQGIYSEYAKSVMNRYYEIKEGVDIEKSERRRDYLRAESMRKMEESREQYLSGYKCKVTACAGVTSELMRLVGGNVSWYEMLQ